MRTAVEALGATKQGIYLPVLEELAVDAPAPVRVAAIRGLGALRPDGLEAKLQGSTVKSYVSWWWPSI